MENNFSPCYTIDTSSAICGTFDIVQHFPTSPKRKSISSDVRRYIYSRDNYTCKICKRYMPNGFVVENNKVIKINIDHIVAVQNGGDNNIDNLQVLCGTCNKMKGTKPMSIFVGWGKTEICI